MRIQGGLGNQLNTYGLGRALAQYVGADLVLDAEDYRSRTYKTGEKYRWPYYLDKLNVPERLASIEEMEGVLGTVDHSELEYQPGIFEFVKANYNGDRFHVNCMGGDWRYHEPVVGVLREQLTPLTGLSATKQGLLEEIRSVESVGLHVRLGDYVGNPDCFILPPEYYYDCTYIIDRSVRDPKVFIFTDSPEFLRGNIRVDLPCTLVEGNTAVEDLMLLSACRHKILANSSFSFWAARLDSRKGGVVLAPDTCYLPGLRFKEVPRPSWPPEWRSVPVRINDGYREIMKTRRDTGVFT